MLQFRDVRSNHHSINQVSQVAAATCSVICVSYPMRNSENDVYVCLLNTHFTEIDIRGSSRVISSNCLLNSLCALAILCG